jgi:hypothetical protein
MNEIKKKWRNFAWLSAGIIILFWKLDDIVGLHRDEAIFGLFTEMIHDGARPLYGFFNYYTSPVHAYMLAICTKIIGNSLWSLRCLGPVFTLITIVAIYDIVRQFSVIRARWIACFLITYPPLVMLSRLCGEVFVLNPFLFFGTVWVYVRLCRSQKAYVRKTGMILAGFLMSFGVWNHVIFLPGVVALVICYTIFMWPGIRQYGSNVIFFSIGFLIGLIPRFTAVVLLGNVLFPKKPPIPSASLQTASLNLLYTLSGDSLYARFSGGSAVPFSWGMFGIIIVMVTTFHFLGHDKTEKKLFWGIWAFIACTFFGIWHITPFGSIGSRLWLIPVWLFPILFGMWMADLRAWKWRITGGAMILVNVLLLTVNYYIPNSYSHGMISPSVYVGGKYDNTWDYYDHRSIVEKLAKTDKEYIFVSNINVFTFYYLMPEEQRHRIRLLWPLEIGGMGTTPEKQKLYSRLSYKGPMPKSALFVFYDNDKDYLYTFSKQKYFHLTELNSEISIPGFKVFRLK